MEGAENQMVNFQEEEENIRNQRRETKLKYRKKAIQEYLMKSRIHHINQVQKKIPDFFAQEEQADINLNYQHEEDLKEELEMKGKLNLNQHYHKHPKKDKKKCWFCKSNLHLKRTCPWIRCFYCKKYGHLKKDCFRRKVNFIFNREMERFMNREEEKKNRKKLNKQKKEQKELEKKVFELRLKDMEFKSRKTEKGDVMTMFWREKQIGDYIGPGLPSIILNKLSQHRYNWKYVNVLVEHDIPSKQLILYEGLSNWCGCGKQDLSKRDFLGHTADHHHGMIKKNSQINRPFWLDWVFYPDEDLEYEFCYTISNLDKFK